MSGREETRALEYVPHSSSPTFTGREEILQKMEQALLPKMTIEAAVSRRAFVLHGLGGSRKTEICCMYNGQKARDFGRPL